MANKTVSCWTEVAVGFGMTSVATSITFTGSARAVSVNRNFVCGQKKVRFSRKKISLAVTEKRKTKPVQKNFIKLPCLIEIYIFYLSILFFVGPPICGSPEKSENTTIVGSKRTIGSTIDYVCPDGYMLVGSKSRMCGSSGFWSGDVPTCKCECEISIVSQSNHSPP